MQADRTHEVFVTVAILAGGRGQRLGGVDKGLHPLHGKPLVETVLARVRAQHVGKVIIVANRNVERYASYASTLSDRDSGFGGPLAGIAAALDACTTPWLVTLPVDCPTPPPDLVQRLLSAAFEHGAQIAVAHDGARRQPLFAICAKDLANDSVLAASAGDGAWCWQDRHGAVEIDFADRQAHFHNLNTAVDFDDFEERSK